MASKSRRPRKSKLDAHLDIVGTLPDKEVATRAGVTAENVRTYRARRGIPAGWRGEAREEPAPVAAKPAKKPTRRRKNSRPRRRKSKLDPFVHLLGEVPDRQLAEMAGVSPENVRSFRVRRGVPALWRGEGRAAQAAAPAASTPKAKPAPKPASAPRTGGLRRAAAKARVAAVEQAMAMDSGPGRGWAWQVVVEVEGGTQKYVSFGDDVVSAAVAAAPRVEELHPGARIRSVEILAEAL